jgi:hypothetical protein
MIARDFERSPGETISISIYISAPMTMRLRERLLSKVFCIAEYLRNTALGLLSFLKIIALLNDAAPAQVRSVLIFVPALRRSMVIFFRTRLINAVIEAELKEPPTS